jgi:hypothetical protein
MKTITVSGVKEGVTSVTSRPGSDGDLVTFTNVTDADDDYHTFTELYEHRYTLFLALVRQYWQRYRNSTWMSKLHSDGTMFEGCFVLGIYKEPGEQITYHLPLKYWDEALKGAIVLERAPEYDGHMSQDVLERLKRL